MDKVQHFEIPVDDMARAQKFYEKAFGWRIVEDPNMQYVMAYTGKVDSDNMHLEPDFINGGLVHRGSIFSSPCLYVTVNSVKDSLKKVQAEGGTVVMEPKEMGDMGIFAFIKDSEGNLMGVWESKRKS